MERLERFLSHPTAKAYHTRALSTSETRTRPYINENGHLDFSPGDIENPKNWSQARRWYITIVSVTLVINATFASSSPSGSVDGIAEQFSISVEAANLVITLFLLGYGFGPLFCAPLSEFCECGFTCSCWPWRLAANTVCRSACGAAAPLFTQHTFNTLGVGGGGSLIGSVATLLAPILFVFYRYGGPVRERSKFAPTENKSGGEKEVPREQDTRRGTEGVGSENGSKTGSGESSTVDGNGDGKGDVGERNGERQRSTYVQEGQGLDRVAKDAGQLDEGPRFDQSEKDLEKGEIWSVCDFVRVRLKGLLGP